MDLYGGLCGIDIFVEVIFLGNENELEALMGGRMNLVFMDCGMWKFFWVLFKFNSILLVMEEVVYYCEVVVVG